MSIIALSPLHLRSGAQDRAKALSGGVSIPRMINPSRRGLIQPWLLTWIAAFPGCLISPAAGRLQPMMPGASLSLTEVVHFRHCLHPPDGGRTDMDRGTP